jgi:hypothetical protein
MKIGGRNYSFSLHLNGDKKLPCMGEMKNIQATLITS